MAHSAKGIRSISGGLTASQYADNLTPSHFYYSQGLIRCQMNLILSSLSTPRPLPVLSSWNPYVLYPTPALYPQIIQMKADFQHSMKIQALCKSTACQALRWFTHLWLIFSSWGCSLWVSDSTMLVLLTVMKNRCQDEDWRGDKIGVEW